MKITSWHKKTSYGAFFKSAIGGFFFQCPFFNGLVHSIIRSLFVIPRRACRFALVSGASAFRPRLRLSNREF